MSDLQAVANQPTDDKTGNLVLELLQSMPVDGTGIPQYVVELLQAAERDDHVGDVSWTMAGLWALGQVEYVAPNFWDGTPASWRHTSDVN